MRSFGFFTAIAVAILFFSCEKGSNDDKDSGKGYLRLKFNDNPVELSKSTDIEKLDTNYFLLTIRKDGGSVVFDGQYCEASEELELEAGSYHVYVRSSDFEKPAFSEPQFGDEQCIIVPAGETVSAHLQCAQINSGVKLIIDPDFLTEYPKGVFFLSSDKGRLMYSYSEKRIAYFKPGTVSLVLMNDTQEEVLLSRSLAAQEILSLKISVSKSKQTKKGLKVSVDTSRIWLDETYTMGHGESNNGLSQDDAMTVNQARSSVGKEDVWVSGFIVGGDLTSTSASFSAPFKSETNLLIGVRKSVPSRDNCIAVQLPSGNIRDALNLAGNPEMLGREVRLKGDIVDSYFGLVGLKNVSDFVLGQ